MFSRTIFELGPYKVCFWNILIITIIYSVAFIISKVIRQSLKKYLMGANIKLEGRKTTWLRLMSQSIYLLAAYIAIISFKINNVNVSFGEFLNYQIIELDKLKLSFYQIILVIGIFFCARMSVNFMKLYYNRKFNNKKDINSNKEYIYVQISKYVIYVFSIFFSLNIFEIDLTIFLTGSAALLVGLGLGLQDVFRDFFSGLVLLFEGTIKIGDVIELRDSKFEEPVFAKILNINIRTTQIQTREGNVFIIPNAKLTQEYVENWSQGHPYSRSQINVSVAYGSDTDLVVKLLKQAAESNPKVIKKDPIEVRLKDFGDSGLEMELLFWVEHNWEVNIYKSEIRFEIDRLFRENNIVIPYPHRQVILTPTNE